VALGVSGAGREMAGCRPHLDVESTMIAVGAGKHARHHVVCTHIHTVVAARLCADLVRVHLGAKARVHEIGDDSVERVAQGDDVVEVVAMFQVNPPLL